MAPKAAAGVAQRRPAGAGRTSQQECRDPPKIGPFVACLKRLAELGAQAGGSLRSLPTEATDLDALAPAASRDELAMQLRESGSREFWHAALAVHAYNIRDCLALYEELCHLRRQHQASLPSLHAGAVPVFTADYNQLAWALFSTLVVLLEVCFKQTANHESTANSASAARALALIRGDTLQVYAAILDAVARSKAPAWMLPVDAAFVGMLLMHIRELSAITLKCTTSSDMALAQELARALAHSNVVEHACRAFVHVQASANAQAGNLQAAGGGAAGQSSAERVQMTQEDLEGTCHLLERGAEALTAVVTTLCDLAAAATSSSSSNSNSSPPANAAGEAGPPDQMELREHLQAALGCVLRGRGLHFWVVKGLLDAGNASVVVCNRFTALLDDIARLRRQPSGAGLAAQVPGPAGQQGAALPERWMGLPLPQRMLVASFERAEECARVACTSRSMGPVLDSLLARMNGLVGPLLRSGQAFYAFSGAARQLWQATGMKPTVNAKQAATAAGCTPTFLARRPFTVAHVCAALGHGLQAITGTSLMAQGVPDSLGAYRDSVFGFSAEVGSSVELLCQLAIRLRGREAVRLLGTVWTCGAVLQSLLSATAAQGGMTAALLEKSAAPALEAMGDLLLHKYDKEKKLKFPGRTSGCGMSLDFALCSRAIFQLRASLRDTLAPPSGRAQAVGVRGPLRLALTDRFLRRSCALPALLTFGHPEEVCGLLVTLRQALFVADGPAAGGPGPSTSSSSRALSAPAGSGTQAQMVWLVVQLLEQVVAVCFHAPPPPPRPAWKKGSKGGPAAAAQEKGSIAGRLTDSAKRDVPAERLQQMWAAAQAGNGASDAAAVGRDNATRLPVYALLQLLPAVIQSGQVAELSETHKDFTVGLSRVFLAAAVHGLSAMQRATHDVRAASNVRAGRHDARRKADEIIAMTAANSWSMLVVDQSGMYQWLARALGVSTAKRWPEGHAAALDVLEVLTVTVPDEEFVMWVRLHTGKGTTAAPTGAPASPSVPVIQLGEGWLQQLGRHNLAAALKAKGCASGADGAGGSSSRDMAIAAAAGYQLLHDVSWNQHLADLPPLVCPIDAMRGMDVTYNFRPCSFPQCTRVPVPEVPGAAPGADPSTMRCGRCRVESYCGPECQRAHWREGHKVECPRLAKMRTDLEAVAVMMTFGGMVGV